MRGLRWDWLVCGVLSSLSSQEQWWSCSTEDSRVQILHLSSHVNSMLQRVRVCVCVCVCVSICVCMYRSMCMKKFTYINTRLRDIRCVRVCGQTTVGPAMSVKAISVASG